MTYRVLATDYDGTLAHDGVVSAETVDALRALARAGWRLLLVTGRRLDDLLGVFADLPVFDLVVAENGGLLYDPGSRSEQLLAPPPDPVFVAALRERGVEPLAVGRIVVASLESQMPIVQQVIDRTGMRLHIELNKGSLMVLPGDVTKVTGLVAALARLGCSAAETIAVGDAENDLPFLRASGFAVAVANALPEVKADADLVTAGARGEGIVELAGRLLEGGVSAGERGPHRLAFTGRTDTQSRPAT